MSNEIFMLDFLEKKSIAHENKYQKLSLDYEQSVNHIEVEAKNKKFLEEVVQTDKRELKVKKTKLVAVTNDITAIVSNEDLTDPAVTNKLQLLKEEKNELEININLLESTISSNSDVIESLASSVASNAEFVEVNKAARNRYKEALTIFNNNDIYNNQLLQYSDIMERLAKLFPTLDAEISIAFEPDKFLFESFTLINNNYKLDFAVKPEISYSSTDTCMGCYMGMIYTYCNNFTNIDKSEDIYDFFYTVNKNDIHFDTFTDEYGTNRLRGLYLKNPQAINDEESYIKISVDFYEYGYREYGEKEKNDKNIVLSFASKPTVF